MFCSKCGSTCNENSKFCHKCGVSLKKEIYTDLRPDNRKVDMNINLKRMLIIAFSVACPFSFLFFPIFHAREVVSNFKIVFYDEPFWLLKDDNSFSWPNDLPSVITGVVFIACVICAISILCALVRNYRAVIFANIGNVILLLISYISTEIMCFADNDRHRILIPHIGFMFMLLMTLTVIILSVLLQNEEIKKSNHS